MKILSSIADFIKNRMFLEDLLTNQLIFNLHKNKKRFFSNV